MVSHDYIFNKRNIGFKKKITIVLVQKEYIHKLFRKEKTVRNDNIARVLVFA